LQQYDFGQPIDGIVQVAYVVPDIDLAMQSFSERFKAGPWFVGRRRVPAALARYRGGPATAMMSTALGYAGSMMFELMQAHDDQPSILREVIDRSGYGFHHWGVGVRDFDEQAAALEANAATPIFSSTTPRGARVKMYENVLNLPGLVELIEMTDHNVVFYGRLKAAALAGGPFGILDARLAD
jgi:hypothetical protein